MNIAPEKYRALRNKVVLHLTDLTDDDIAVFDVTPTVERKGYRSETSWVNPNKVYCSDPMVKVSIEVELPASMADGAMPSWVNVIEEVKQAEFQQAEDHYTQRVAEAEAAVEAAQRQLALLKRDPK